MPYYEFECSCGKISEELVKMDTQEITCPECGGKATKIMSLCAFSLKGSGWYADGYSSSKGGASKSSGTSTSSTKTSDAKAPSKAQ